MVYSESEIVHELEAGNEVCLNMLFDNYYRSLCVYAFRFVSDGDDVEDIVQEVFVSFWMNKKRTVFSGSIRSYLFGAVAKAASKFATRRGKIKFDDVEKYVDQFLEELGNTMRMNSLDYVIKYMPGWRLCRKRQKKYLKPWCWII